MSFVTKSTETYSIYFGVIAKKFKAKKKILELKKISTKTITSVKNLF